VLRCQQGRYASSEGPVDWLRMLWFENKEAYIIVEIYKYIKTDKTVFIYPSHSWEKVNFYRIESTKDCSKQKIIKFIFER